MKILVMAHGVVGSELIDWMLQFHPNDVAGIVTMTEDDIYKKALSESIPSHIYSHEDALIYWLSQFKFEIDWGLLIWWPKIIKKQLLQLPKNGFLNTHPSLLPHNRGKHPNFWALVEERPFGVSIHKVDGGIDSGAVVAQAQIDCNWEDTGGTLYKKSQVEMISLFKNLYPSIQQNVLCVNDQDPRCGSFHMGWEMNVKSRLLLDEEYTARELLNLLRARTFEGLPSCTFEDAGIVYEVRVEILRKD